MTCICLGGGIFFIRTSLDNKGKTIKNNKQPTALISKLDQKKRSL